MSELLNFLEAQDIDVEDIPNSIRILIDPKEAYLYLLRGYSSFENLPSNRYKSYDEITESYLNSIDPKILKVISKDPKQALNFALRFYGTKGWPQGEAAIASKPETVLEYSKECIKRRFIEGEPTILQSAIHNDTYAISYSKDVIGGRWRELESFILEDIPNMIVPYCVQVMNSGYLGYYIDNYDPKVRWPEGEQLLLSLAKIDEYYLLKCVDYALLVLHSRWPELEKMLKNGKTKDAGQAAGNYVISVLPIDKAISNNSNPRNAQPERWPDLEKTILLDPWSTYFYIKKVLDNQESATLFIWPEGEESIATDADASFTYATDYLGGRFAKGESVMKQDANTWTNYISFLGHRGYDLGQSPWAQS